MSPVVSPRLALLLSLALAASVRGADITAAQIAAETAKANAFFDQAFEEKLARNPEQMTVLGIKRDYDKWADRSEARAAESLEIVKRQMADLKRTINPEALDAQASVSYRLFLYEGELAVEGWRWRNHAYVLDQMDGVHSDAPAFLIAYHRIDDVSDARAYIARLRGMGPLFDQTIANLKARQQLGVLPPKFVFPLVLESCQQVVTGAPFDSSAQPSALWEDFTAKLAALKGLPEADREALRADARRALVEVVGPAYARLVAVLEAQAKVATDDDGVWKLPDGAAYYAFRLRQSITTSLTPDEVHELGLREVARIHREMEAIMKQVGFTGDLQAFFKHLREDPKYYYRNTPEDIDAYVRRATEVIDRMRTRLPEFFGILPKAQIILRRVEPFREKGSAAAFYESPAPDGSRPGVYYVNTIDMQGLPIFELETLAYHEGIPGHHMQNAIAQELQGLPKFRRFGGNVAYDEGWALYSEYFPKEFGFFSDPYMDFGRLYDELLRAVRLVVDTGIHSRHWTREQVMNYFRHNTPNPERDVFTETNRYIVNPGQACGYKIGMLKILELRERAKRDLGARFDIREYHDLVLGNGALPMALLEENVMAWIARKKG